MDMVFSGRTWLFGNDVDTDHIIPARYLQIKEVGEMSRHCFTDIRPEFAAECKPGDILVAGKNFGCGSSRQFAPLVIRACGISCVVAESFSRLFLRNAVNMGFPAVELPLSRKLIREGDIITVDAIESRIVNESRGEVYETIPIPSFMRGIYEAGGLEGHIRERLKAAIK